MQPLQPIPPMGRRSGTIYWTTAGGDCVEARCSVVSARVVLIRTLSALSAKGMDPAMVSSGRNSPLQLCSEAWNQRLLFH